MQLYLILFNFILFELIELNQFLAEFNLILVPIVA